MASTDTDMEELQVSGPGSFVFSAVRPENLGAVEYTLVVVICDVSGSVDEFADEMLKTVRKIVEACRKSERSENLMLRFVTFNSQVEEVHGFKELFSIDENDYSPLNPGGVTALYDAAFSGIGSVLTYAETLMNQDFDVNGAVYIITDGADNDSSLSPSDIKKLTDEAKMGEKIESLVTVLVGLKDPGITGDQWAKQVSVLLDEFHKKAGLTQYVPVGDASPQRLAKLAEFVSRSISSQSNALGSGGPSQPLSVTF